MVLEILNLVLCNRHRWTGKKRNLAVTAVHLSGLVARNSEWQNTGFIGMWASETGKSRSPQKEVTPFSSVRYGKLGTSKGTRDLGELGELGELSSTTTAEPVHS